MSDRLRDLLEQAAPLIDLVRRTATAREDGSRAVEVLDAIKRALAEPTVCEWWWGAFDDAPEDEDGWHTTCHAEDRCTQEMLNEVRDNTTISAVIDEIGLSMQLGCPNCRLSIRVVEK